MLLFLLIVFAHLAVGQENSAEPSSNQPMIILAGVSYGSTVFVKFNKNIGIFGHDGWFIYSQNCEMVELVAMSLSFEERDTIIVDYDYDLCGPSTLFVTIEGQSNVRDEEGNMMLLRNEYFDFAPIVVGINK